MSINNYTVGPGSSCGASDAGGGSQTAGGSAGSYSTGHGTAGARGDFLF
jgi:hypothetical protein